jgi:hypothetical protein
MNLIICNENCKHQQDGYCSLEGGAKITNALSAPCCYYETGADKSTKKLESAGITG